jgi:RimJ/RimL family protein N-acetyltransferase
MALVDHWPLFGLRVGTPLLELRPPDDDIALAMGELAVKGVHDPAFMPFSFAWTDAPADELPRNTLQHLWQMRAELRPNHWHVSLAVLADGRVVGGASLGADDFGLRRTFETGSWLGQAFQGQGLGAELRQACLHLGFAGLGADLATTAAWHDNGASLGVTRKLGYEPNGEDLMLRRDTDPTRMLRFRMPRAHWEAKLRRDDIELDGVEACLPLLRAEPSGEGGA